MTSEDHARRLDATRSPVGEGHAHISRGAKDADDPAQRRSHDAARKHMAELLRETVMLHHGDGGQPALVTRTMGDPYEIFVMTETESLNHYGPHAGGQAKNEGPYTIGNGIAHAASELGCAVTAVAALALIAFLFYMIGTT